MEKQVYRTLSSRAAHLIACEEGYDVEFKKSLADLSNEDLVAFANSHQGGAILIGAEEARTSNGRQRGKIVGCIVGDRERVSIINRAETCVPPIEIDVFIENERTNPFFRIEIPSGGNKPYCTQSGIYKTRGYGRNLPLLPPRLLSIFIEEESGDFLERFRLATSELENRLESVRVKLSEVQSAVEDVSTQVVDAQTSADESVTQAEMASSVTQDIVDSIPVLHEKLDALLGHFNIPNPDLLAELAFYKFAEDYLSKNKPTNKKKKRVNPDST
jgi:hypothetical protein